MKKILTGDTIRFTTTVNDSDGTSLTGATVTLTVTDASGSTVLSDTISHDTDGTYAETKSTSGWGFGPVQQKWTIEDNSGTLTKLNVNEFKIVDEGTVAASYVYESELKSFFPSITDHLDNQSEDHVIAAYKYTNRILDGLGYHTPVAESDDALFDQSVRDHNAWDAIYRIVRANEIDKTRKEDDGKYWFESFKDMADSIYDDWKTKKITFKRKVSPGEAGIEPSARTQGSTAGTMLNNHDEKWGKGFSGSDYQRKWSVEITGTGTSGGLRECTFKWSNDDGIGTTLGTISDGWSHLDQQVYVRFTRGTSSIVTNLFKTGDKWEWETNPIRNQTGGKNIAVGYG